MSANIPCKDLPRVLTGLSRVAPNRSNVAVLGSVRLQCSHSEATLTATDLDQTLAASIDGVEAYEPLDTLIPLAELRDFVRTSDRFGQIEVSASDGFVQLKDLSLGIARKLAVQPVGDFPPLPPPPACSRSAGGRLWQAMRLASKSTRQDSGRPAIGGVLIEPECVVGTDGRHLAMFPLFVGLDRSVVVPVSKLFGSDIFDGDCEIGLTSENPARLNIRNERWSWTVKLTDAEFPAWRQVMPPESSLRDEIRIDESALPTVVKALDKMGRTASQPMRIVATPSGITLSTDDESLAAFKVGGYLVGGGEPRTMWVGKEMLARVFELGHHRIRLGDNFAPVSAEAHAVGFTASACASL